MTLRRLRLPVLLLLLAAAPAVAQAPAVVTPGSALLDGTRVASGSHGYVLGILQGGVDQRVGDLTLRTRVVERGGRALLARTETFRLAYGDVLAADTFEVDRATLAAVSLRRLSDDGKTALAFADGRIRGTADGAVVDLAVEEPAFYGNSIDLVLGSLPLAVGFAATLPLLDESDGSVRRATVAVAAEETVRTADGGSCRALRVEVEDEDASSTYWIAPDTRLLVRFRGDGEGELTLLRAERCPMADTRSGGA